MKKITIVLSIIILSISNNIFAIEELSENNVTLDKKIVIQNKQVDLTQEQAFNYFWDYFSQNIKESYKYINVNFRWIKKDSDLYKSFQKLIYLNILENKDFFIAKNKTLTSYEFYKLAEKLLWIKLIEDKEIVNLKSEKANNDDFKKLEKKLEDLRYKIPDTWFSDSKIIESKKDIFSDVYKILQKDHYNKNNLNEEKLLDWVIQWLANSSEDKFTTYFPPADNKNFNEALTGEYEWIWAYVEMIKAWEVAIVSPISGTPSEKAWLQWWDIIIKVDNKEITKDTSLQMAVSWIKWKAWTTVALTIKRWANILNIDVIRWNIVIKDLEYKKLDNSTFYIDIRFFWPNVATDFKNSLESLKSEENINKIIIDLRNNPGWYLDQVTDMLSCIVPTWEPTAIVKYSNKSSYSYKSVGYDIIDFSKYQIVILQNSWSASASEIMISTMKDYLPKTSLVWEKTYWKGSVQTVKEYKDGSSFKYTIARWFSGKTETWIDGIWIKPDYEVIVDKYIKDESSDPQLNKAKSIY